MFGANLSLMRAQQEEDKVGVLIMASCCMRDGELCYASQEDVDVLGALINPDFDVEKAQKWLMSLPQDLRE